MTDDEIAELSFPHEDNCGHCEQGRLMEKLVMKPLRDNKNLTRDQLDDLDKEFWRQWRETKYFKLAQECNEQGVDWKTEFDKRGWQP